MKIGKFLLGGIFLLALFFSMTKVFAAEMPSVAINEVMWMGSSKSSSDEWIELKNNTNQSIDLAGWQIENAGKSHQDIIMPKDKGYIIPADGYFLIARCSTNLNSDYQCKTTNLANEADFISDQLSLTNTSNGNLILKNNLGEIIDQALAEPWPAGENDTKNNFRYSMERVNDAVDGTKIESWQTAWDNEGFIIGAMEKGTPWGENSVYAPPPPKEFPESVTRYLDMSKTTIAEATVTSIIDGDTIEVNSGGKLQKVRMIGVDSPESSANSQFKIDEPFYSEAKDFAKNTLLEDKKIDLLISADESKAYDSYGRLLAAVVIDDELFNTTLIKNGLARTYFLENELIKSSEWTNEEAKAQDNRLGIWRGYGIGKVIINEIMPNPAGSDKENEWIELFNYGDQNIDLGNWFLDDEEGGSKPYKFAASTIIAPGEYKIFSITESKISLNNDEDKVRIFRPDLSMVEEIHYPKAIEGESYSRFNDNWSWTDNLTKGYLNLPHSSESTIPNNNPANNTGGSDIETANSIKEAKNLPNDTAVSVTGIVSVIPGILSSQYFYIEDQSSGMQIYSYYKRFPSLSVGDKIQVKGIISGSEIKRIKINQANDIIVLARDNEIVPKNISLPEINREFEGQLVKIKGKVVKLSGNNVYIEDNGFTVIMQIRKTAGFERPDLEKESIVEVIGIIYLVNDKIYILPRSINDIKIESYADTAIKTNAKNNKFVGVAKAADIKNTKKNPTILASNNFDSRLLDADYLDIDNKILWQKIIEYVIISTSVLLIGWIILWLSQKSLLPPTQIKQKNVLQNL